MGQREILTGAVAELHASQEHLEQTMAELSVTAMRVKAERDDAIRLLRATLELREMGSEGQHKTSIRMFLARAGELPSQFRSVTRIDRMQLLERELVAIQPEADDALQLVQAWYRGVEDRYGKARCDDLRRCVNDVEEAIGELEVER